MLPPLSQDDATKIRNIIESRIILHDFFYNVDKRADTFTHIFGLAKNNVMIFLLSLQSKNDCLTK